MHLSCSGFELRRKYHIYGELIWELMLLILILNMLTSQIFFEWNSKVYYSSAMPYPIYVEWNYEFVHFPRWKYYIPSFNDQNHLLWYYIIAINALPVIHKSHGYANAEIGSTFVAELDIVNKYIYIILFDEIQVVQWIYFIIIRKNLLYIVLSILIIWFIKSKIIFAKKYKCEVYFFF